MSADPYVDVVAARLADFLERSRAGDDLPETLWQAALVMIDRSTDRTRNWHWWRSYPRGELRRLREGLAEALTLARLAAALQDAHNAGEQEATREARELAADAAAARRRAQTMPAELARLAKVAARRSEGQRGVNFHLAPEYGAESPLDGPELS